MRSDLVLRIKIAVVVAAALVAAAGFGGSYFGGVEKVRASASGPSPSFTNAPGESNCTACHTGFPVNTGTGGVQIGGLPATYTPGQQIPMTVTVTQVDGVTFGFQLTAVDSQGRAAGTFTVPSGTPPRTQVVTGIVGGNQRSYIEHTIDGLYLPNVFGSNTWNFTWTAPANAVGPISFYAAGNGANSDGGPGGDYIYTTSRTLQAAVSAAAPFDFDGDRKTDIGIYRPNPGQWWYTRSSNGSVFAAAFGTSTDVITPGDYTGDGKTDVAFFRPSTGQWFVLRSEDNSFFAFPFGTSGDVPAPADFDGDRKTDPAVFRTSNSTWFVLRSTDGGVSAAQFGAQFDRPIPADYDGDGKADIAIFRPSGSTQAVPEYWLLRSSAGLFAVAMGSQSDKPVIGDWTGDGKADIAFYRDNATSQWYVLRSEDNASFFAFPLGTSGDIPAPGDYDGDSKFDAAVFRPSNATWFVNKSTGGTQIVQFGTTGDQPIPNAFVR